MGETAVEWFNKPDTPNKARLWIWAREFLKRCDADQCGDPRGTPLIRISLREADLSGADLIGVDLSRADLRGANLRQADLAVLRLIGVRTDWWIRFLIADLRGAALGDANLSKAYLNWANLRGAHGLTLSMIRSGKNWQQAFYPVEFLEKLGLPADHNEILEAMLGEKP